MKKRRSDKYDYKLGVLFLLLVSASLFVQGCGKCKSLSDKKNSYSIISYKDTITGVTCMVFDKTFNSPVKDAIVMIEADSTHSITDEDGSAKMFTPPGKYRIIVVYLGIRLRTRLLKVSPGERLIVNCNLFIHRIAETE